MLTLFGDGIHDDTAAIQELIDNADHELILSQPQNYYLISKPLEIPSNFRLVLPRYAEIKLADNSNCFMLKNKTKDIPDYKYTNSLWSYLDRYSPDEVSENIEVCGGVWNCNNLGQFPNPQQCSENMKDGYTGFGMLFFSVRGMTLRSLTVKDPINFAITFDKVSYFTVEDIFFDFNYGNPTAVNMDGVHLCGNCHYGVIKNLKGSTYDDLVALNADEGSCGDITHIEVSGIWSEDCHSAVRLLACAANVENVHIHDIYGTYYQYCIGVTRYYDGDTPGHFSGISIDNVYASKAPRHSIYCKDGSYVYPLIYIESNAIVNDLSISNLRRHETDTPIETVSVLKGAVVKNLSLSCIYTTNQTGEYMPLFVNKGTINELSVHHLEACDDPVIINYGEIKKKNF